MADLKEDWIDFAKLEKELDQAVEKDARYWRENEAKFRAVEQRVETYEQFRWDRGRKILSLTKFEDFVIGYGKEILPKKLSRNAFRYLRKTCLQALSSSLSVNKKKLHPVCDLWPVLARFTIYC